MSGYQWRGGAKCNHVGTVWNPPNKVVAEVPCPYCKAPANAVCTGARGIKVEPHSARYIAHHDATCASGQDYAV